LYFEASEWDRVRPWDRGLAILHLWHHHEPDAVFGGASALVLRGLPVMSDASRVELVHADMPRLSRHRILRGDRRVGTFIVQRHREPGALSVEQRGNWRCEGVASASVRVAGGAKTPLDAAVVALDGAWRALGGGASGRQCLDSAVEKLPAHAARVRARAALQLASPLAESAAESLARVAIHQLGFRAPMEQREVVVDGERYRPDFMWEGKLVLEVDGENKYAGPDEAEVRRAERRRQAALERAGYRVLRVTWRDIMSPERLRAVLVHLGVSSLTGA